MCADIRAEIRLCAFEALQTHRQQDTSEYLARIQAFGLNALDVYPGKKTLTVLKILIGKGCIEWERKFKIANPILTLRCKKHRNLHTACDNGFIPLDVLSAQKYLAIRIDNPGNIRAVIRHDRFRRFFMNGCCRSAELIKAQRFLFQF